MGDLVPSTNTQALSRALNRLGWSCLQADINLTFNTARLCFKHSTGRVVTLDADGRGRVSLTREQREISSHRVGRRGDSFIADVLHTTFLGRDKFSGIRSATRALADYLADNAGADRQLARVPLAGLLTDATRAAEDKVK